jgi:hypothetical protein
MMVEGRRRRATIGPIPRRRIVGLPRRACLPDGPLIYFKVFKIDLL